MPATRSRALITGASTGIGATYADRFARRGYDLVLVARDRPRLETVAARIRSETGVRVDTLAADLTREEELARVEARLREDGDISLLINNAGAAQHGGFSTPDLDEWGRLISLNILAMTRLTGAVIPQFLARGGGAIINLSSVVALAPEIPLGVYNATKAYALSFSQSLQAELGSRGIYVQAVLPGATPAPKSGSVPGVTSTLCRRRWTLMSWLTPRSSASTGGRPSRSRRCRMRACGKPLMPRGKRCGQTSGSRTPRNAIAAGRRELLASRRAGSPKA